MSEASKTRRLRELLHEPQTTFLLEAHSGLSARIAQEAGFPAIWASGLAISAALGVRDANEASWSQVLDLVEFLCDATQVPVLLDADTGSGNFNNVRRLVRKAERAGVAGLCIEDKLFPKKNSLCGGGVESLADVDEFSGRIRAAKDSQTDPDTVIVARTEAMVVGGSVDEALHRARAYREAGADAVLAHSMSESPHEVLEFMKRWKDTCPVVLVPTTYASTPTRTLEEAGASMIIWANHLVRASIVAMQRTAATILAESSVAGVEPRIASLAEVFRLQDMAELERAEARYLPERNAEADEASTDEES